MSENRALFNLISGITRYKINPETIVTKYSTFEAFCFLDYFLLIDA